MYHVLLLVGGSSRTAGQYRCDILCQRSSYFIKWAPSSPANICREMWSKYVHQLHGAKRSGQYPNDYHGDNSQHITYTRYIIKVNYILIYVFDRSPSWLYHPFVDPICSVVTSQLKVARKHTSQPDYLRIFSQLDHELAGQLTV